MKGPQRVFSECLLHSRCCPGVNAHLPVGGCWKRKLGCEESTALRRANMEVLSFHSGIGAPTHILPVEGKVGGVLATLDGGSVSTVCVKWVVKVTDAGTAFLYVERGKTCNLVVIICCSFVPPAFTALRRCPPTCFRPVVLKVWSLGPAAPASRGNLLNADSGAPF